LRIKVVVNHSNDNLDVTLGLHERALDSEWRVQRAIRFAHDHSGNDRVVRSFARRERVRMIRVKPEAVSAIFQHKAPPLRHDAGAKGAIVAAYQLVTIGRTFFRHCPRSDTDSAWRDRSGVIVA